MPIRIITILPLLLLAVHPSHAQRAKAKDLGLSVKWADRNVGATAPHQYGNYYAWGETKSKRHYGYYSTYKHYNYNPRHFSKYNYVPYENSVIDNLLPLQPTDDVGTRRMGNSWRTPTQEEYQELQQKCTFTPAIHHGTHGFWIKNRTTPSDSIFLPMTGYKEWGNRRTYPGVQGNYWTSTLIGEEIHDDSLMNANMTTYVGMAKNVTITT